MSAHFDPIDANLVSLELYEIAHRLEKFSIDNGPMGESRPFSQEALRLRQFAQMIAERCGKHFTHQSNPSNGQR